MTAANRNDRHGPGIRLHPPIIYAIAREERYLEKLSGRNGLDYKARVRRWF
jgi:protein-S-isoprenylcysteine O-methyltransferase Ste14